MPELWLPWVDVVAGAACGILLRRFRYPSALGRLDDWIVGGVGGAAAGGLVYGLLVFLGLFSMLDPMSTVEQLGISTFLLGAGVVAFLLGKRS